MSGADTQTDTVEQTVTEQIIQNAPGAAKAAVRRSLQMRHFKTTSNIKHAVEKQETVPLGQIVGQLFEIQERPGQLPDGTPKTSLLAVGDFEAVVYETGEVINAQAAYLPGYYSEALRANLSAGKAFNAVGMVFAVEICAEPTGKDERTGLPRNPAYSYIIKNLVARDASNPIEAMKRKMAQAGVLRLPPPVALPKPRQAMLPSRPNGEAEPVPNDFEEEQADPEAEHGGGGAPAAAETARTPRAGRQRG